MVIQWLYGVRFSSIHTTRATAKAYSTVQIIYNYNDITANGYRYSLHGLAELVSTSQALPLFPPYLLRAVKYARPHAHHCQHATHTLNIHTKQLEITVTHTCIHM